MPGIEYWHALRWDFNLFQPDAIIINLGSNDYSYCRGNSDLLNQFVDGYVDFLKVIRRHNPKAEIICILGMAGSNLYEYICKAAQRFTEETKDDRITTVKIPKPDGYDRACEHHPTAAAHSETAAHLVPIIREIMGW